MKDRLALLASPVVRSAVARELGREVEYHAVLRSTQERARERAGSGATSLVVVADEQTAGQGTRGRTWDAPAGTALLSSWVWRPSPLDPALMSLLAGVALARALDAVGVPGARLKWPNDVLLGERKVAGVLAHGTTDASGGELVVGIGINVGQTAFPDGLAGRATSLALAGHAVDRLVLLVRLSTELDRLAPTDARAPALAEWRARATLLGHAVLVRSEGRADLSGVARDIGDDGALIIETVYGHEHIHAGEVTVGHE